MNEQTAQKRRELISRLFPGGIPRIWCPLLTQYTPDGGIDAFRMRALLRSLAPHVGGLMLTGDLGDGWQLSRRQCDQVLAACLDDARALGMRVLFAVAEEESQDAYGTIVYHLEALARIHGKDSALENLIAAGLCGYSIFAPFGAGQEDQRIEEALRPILNLGAPVAIINSPASTGTTLSPALIGKFCDEFPNFYLYQDNSGLDEYVLSPYDDDSLITLRGVEFDYNKWYNHYDGFMLPFANSFASTLTRVWAEREDENEDVAKEMSLKMDGLIRGLLDLAERLEGNATQNAVRLCDHFRAYGKDAWEMDVAPTLDGTQYPARLVEQVGDLINDSGLLNENGYLL